MPSRPALSVIGRVPPGQSALGGPPAASPQPEGLIPGSWHQVGSVEFWLVVLVAVELLALWRLRRAFQAAQGG